MASRKPFDALNTPELRSWFFQILAILFAIIAVWVIVAYTLSRIGGIGTILLTIVLAGYVFYRSHQQQQREWRIHRGCCSACGYDLRATPNRCPECGREASQDEPAWRKVRRQHEVSKLVGTPPTVANGIEEKVTALPAPPTELPKL